MEPMFIMGFFLGRSGCSDHLFCNVPIQLIDSGTMFAYMYI